MALTSAGILLFRRSSGVEVFLAHMGGPFWSHKDDGAWSIPKGLYDGSEEPLVAALREFAEEIGTTAPTANYELLGEFRLSSSKSLTVFAAESDFTVETVTSNTFELEWPPRSGRMQLYPEIDDTRWFTVADARVKLTKGQVPLLEALEAL
jgi:predicted NUDIX family NTP pyrophosphohydrolase